MADNPADTRDIVVDYLTALSAPELLDLLGEVLNGGPDDDTAAERRSARRIFAQGRA